MNSPNTMRRRAALRSRARGMLAVPIIAAVLISAGCSAARVAASGADHTTVSSPRAAGTAGGIAPDTADGLRLPVHAYLMTDSQMSELDAAQSVLITKCMKGFGFDYVRPAAISYSGTDLDPTNMARRYGISDAAVAARYGYHLPPSTPEPTTGTNDVTSLSDAEYEVLWGHSKVSNEDLVGRTAGGTAIPEHGCVGESEQEIAAGVTADTQAQLPGQINTDSFSQSQQSPQVEAAIAAWSRCMAASGYQVATPLGAMARFTGPLPASGAELDEAKTDLACKGTTHLIQTWVSVETRIQNRLISQNQSALASTLRADRALLEHAAQILGQ